MNSPRWEAVQLLGPATIQEVLDPSHYEHGVAREEPSDEEDEEDELEPSDDDVPEEVRSSDGRRPSTSVVPTSPRPALQEEVRSNDGRRPSTSVVPTSPRPALQEEVRSSDGRCPSTSVVPTSPRPALEEDGVLAGSASADGVMHGINLRWDSGSDTDSAPRTHAGDLAREALWQTRVGEAAAPRELCYSDPTLPPLSPQSTCKSTASSVPLGGREGIVRLILKKEIYGKGKISELKTPRSPRPLRPGEPE
jgi:hypothetical protein